MRNKRKLATVVLISIFTSISMIFYLIMPFYAPFRVPMDVDYISKGKYNGCYLVSDITGPARIVDSFGRIVWQSPLNGNFIHDCDILPNGNVLIGDTTLDRVLEVDINNSSSLLWSWDARNPDDINWTKFCNDRGWDEINYTAESHPLGGYWTHLNDVDFINGSQFGRTYDSILISLNHFDLVLEVNYSDTKEVIWWYGQPGNHTLLRTQHNPDRYANGNTVICDSGNNRIIEVNTTTKEVVWELKYTFPYGRLRMVRDCDDIGNNQRLITDSGNSRIFIYDMNSMSVVREIKSPFFSSPYEADLLEDGRLVVGGLFSGTIIIMDFESGLILQVIGFPNYWVSPFLLIVSAIIYNSNQLINALKKSEKSKLKKLIDFQVYRRIIYIIIGVLGIVFFNTIVTFLWFFELRG